MQFIFPVIPAGAEQGELRWRRNDFFLLTQQRHQRTADACELLKLLIGRLTRL